MADLAANTSRQVGSHDNLESTQGKDGAVEVVQKPVADAESEARAPADVVEDEKKGFFAFLKTKEFWIILFLG